MFLRRVFSALLRPRFVVAVGVIVVLVVLFGSGNHRQGRSINNSPPTVSQKSGTLNTPPSVDQSDPQVFSAPKSSVAPSALPQDAVGSLSIPARVRDVAVRIASYPNDDGRATTLVRMQRLMAPSALQMIAGAWQGDLNASPEERCSGRLIGQPTLVSSSSTSRVFVISLKQTSQIPGAATAVRIVEYRFEFRQVAWDAWRLVSWQKGA